MIQRHSLILWANPSNEDFHVSLAKANNLLLALKEFGPEIAPNYITSKRKKDALNFDWNANTLEELLKKGINKEGNNQFLDLGYRMSFFSSLREDDSASISLLVGASNSCTTNSLIVNLPLTLPVYESSDINDKLISTFKECVEIFDPFWACIGNNVNVRRFDGYWRDDLPTAIHWVNYFGNGICKIFGDKKIESAPTSSIEKFHLGYIVKLKDSPLNDEIEDDIELQKKVNEYFQS